MEDKYPDAGDFVKRLRSKKSRSKMATFFSTLLRGYEPFKAAFNGTLVGSFGDRYWKDDTKGFDDAAMYLSKFFYPYVVYFFTNESHLETVDTAVKKSVGERLASISQQMADFGRGLDEKFAEVQETLGKIADRAALSEQQKTEDRNALEREVDEFKGHVRRLAS